MKDNSNWIWTGDWRCEYDSTPTAVLFRKTITLNEAVKHAVIKISADSRYKLCINGIFVEAGPSKGDTQIWFYDELDISGYFIPGKNVVAVTVLRFPQRPGYGNQSIISTYLPGLYVEGEITDAAGHNQNISADGSWRCRVDRCTRFVSEREGFAPLHVFEEVGQSEEQWNWLSLEYHDSGWPAAVPYPRAVIREAVSPGNLNQRTIPFMTRKKRRFKAIMALRQSNNTKAVWGQMLAGRKNVTIQAETEEIVEIDAGEEMTGYLYLLLEKGKGASIQILQSEAYVQQGGSGPGGEPQKTNRRDAANGTLEGYSDHYLAAGMGTEALPEQYQPFWFRTFRFIRLKITTAAEPLIIRDFYYQETGYPLELKSQVETSDPSLSAIWDISARTLRRCMQETYTDCPFYEQLQYAMDSRSQMLFTYAISLDDRLARKCLDDFKRSQRYDGLISSAYPNTRPNVIPGFSIFYILMLHDHMMYFGDRELLRYHLPAVEQVLYFFEKNMVPEGYVGKIGGLYRQEKFWSFIDWASPWQVGVPGAVKYGALTMESLLYILGLQKAAELADWLGRNELAREYRMTAERVQQGILNNCMNSEGWIQDGPGVEEYSQHCQVFGVLTGTLEPEQGRKNLLATLSERENYAQCTVSMAFYLFRALEMTDLYEYTNQCWDAWRIMLENQMTTVAESDDYPRSECHAWGALALYELPSVVLGVRPAAPGYGRVEVKPVPGYLDWASGSVMTPNGMLYVEWKRNKDGGIEIKNELIDKE